MNIVRSLIKQVLFAVVTISLATSCAFSINVNVENSILKGTWESFTIYDPSDIYGTEQKYYDEIYVFDDLSNFQYFYKDKLNFSGTYSYNNKNGILVLSDGRDTEFVQIVEVTKSTMIVDYSDNYGPLYVEFRKTRDY